MGEESKVIEAGIKRAHDLFEFFGPSFDRPAEISNGILLVGNICDVLIRIVENQQTQIEFLRGQCDGLQRRIDDMEGQHG